MNKVTNFIEEIYSDENTAIGDKICIGIIVLCSVYFIGHLVVAYLSIPW